jgi:hypothetical protein
MRRVRVIILVVDKQYILHFMSVSVALVIQDAKRIRQLYCHLWPVWL